jgi:acyl-CoA thioester hydrolase
MEEKTLLRVRFSEVDAMRIVWHGHYVSYFEEARRAFGRRFGVDYTVMFDNNTPAPVVQLRLDYYAPARMNDVIEVTARLFKSESAKLEFEYEIYRQGDPTLLAAGATVQVFTNPAGELLLTWPPFMVELLGKWEPLWKQP